MKKLLIFVDWYLPGYKAGGQIQSCANLANALKNDLDIYIVTSDRDMGDHACYEGIKQDEWVNSPYGYKIQYISPENMRYGFIKNIIKEINADSVYLNSMFSLHFTIMVMAAVIYTPSVKSTIVLAPRGMLHDGALQFKRIKKQFFLKSFRLLGIQKRITFHATDTREEIDIRNVFGSKAKMIFVNDFPAMIQPPPLSCKKSPGMLNCIFVSRISPKKNLLYLLDRLKELTGNVHLAIIGPVEDENYWKECLQKIETLPANIVVEYKGSVPNEALHAQYSLNHLFFLPTHGENFGHVIFESLLSGRPVLISDKTPWQVGDNSRIGFSIPLSAPEKYKSALEEAIAWDQDEFDAICKDSWQYAAEYISGSALKEQYIKLFTK